MYFLLLKDMKRLTEIYKIGQQVEITFDRVDWLTGEVVRLAHPGVWVQTEDGRSWFVTNTRHIRHGTDKAKDETGSH